VRRGAALLSVALTPRARAALPLARWKREVLLSCYSGRNTTRGEGIIPEKLAPSCRAPSRDRNIKTRCWRVEVPFGPEPSFSQLVTCAPASSRLRLAQLTGLSVRTLSE